MGKVGRRHRHGRALPRTRPGAQARAAASVFVLAVLFALVALIARPAVAAAQDSCADRSSPPDRIEVSDPAGLWFLEWPVAEVVERQVDDVRSTSIDEATELGFEPDGLDEMTEYFDAVVAYRTTCGEQSDVADSADSDAYGFEGIDPATPPVVSTGFVIAEAEESADDDRGVVPVIALQADRPALATGGSESYILAYFGAGLLAFGATALGMRRWMGGPQESTESG